MIDIGYLIEQIINGPKLTTVEIVKKEVCRKTGLSEEEVNIEVGENGTYHAICRPHKKVETLTINFVIE